MYALLVTIGCSGFNAMTWLSSYRYLWSEHTHTDTQTIQSNNTLKQYTQTIQSNLQLNIQSKKIQSKKIQSNNTLKHTVKQITSKQSKTRTHSNKHSPSHSYTHTQTMHSHSNNTLIHHTQGLGKGPEVVLPIESVGVVMTLVERFPLLFKSGFPALIKGFFARLSKDFSRVNEIIILRLIDGVSRAYLGYENRIIWNPSKVEPDFDHSGPSNPPPPNPTSRSYVILSALYPPLSALPPSLP